MNSEDNKRNNYGKCNIPVQAVRTILVSANHKLYNTNKTKNYLTNNAVFRERFMEIHIQKICALVISIKILM